MENQKTIEVTLTLTPQELQALYIISCREYLGVKNLTTMLEEYVDDTPRDWFN